MAKKTKLKNGLTVITDTNKFVETMVVAIGVNVGNRFEDKKTEGLSHFLEHMAFKGTKKRSYEEVNEAVDFIGGRTNAYTSNEETVYYIKAPKEHFETCLDLLTDQVLNSIFPEEEIVKEAGVIVQEIKRSYDDPNDVMYYNYLDVAFKGNQLSRPILGTEEKVLSYTRQDFLDYHANHYHPKNMVLSVSGNVKHKDVVELAKKYFPQEVEKFKRKKSKLAKFSSGEVVKHIESENQVNVMVTFALPGRKDLTPKQQAALHLFDDIMSSGMGSRLVNEIREKRGLVYSVGAYANMYEEVGAYSIIGGTDHHKIEEFLEATAKVLTEFKATVTEKELQKAKNSFKSECVMSLENISKVCMQNITEFFEEGTAYDHKKYLNEAEALTLQDIKDISDIVLSKNIVLSVYGFVPQHEEITLASFIEKLKI